MKKPSYRQLKIELLALWLAYKDPRIPWWARALAAGVAAYAFSPLDLIPDFVPVLGLLDDLLLLPLGAALARRGIPPAVMAECRAQAAERIDRGKPVSRAGAIAIIILWLALIFAAAILLLKILN